MSKPKIAVTCTIAGLVLLAGLSIPIPWHVSGPFTIEPEGMVEINVIHRGQLMTPEQVQKKVASLGVDDPVREIVEEGLNYTKRIKPGDIVQQGQILAILEDRILEEELRELETRIEMEEKQRDNYDDLDMNAKLVETEKILESLAARKQTIREQLKERVLTADCAGVVIAPVSRPEPQFDEANKHQISMWHGTPLDDRNANCFLDAGEHFCSIAPVEDYEVFLYMDQTDLADVSIDDEVELKFEHMAEVTYTGRVALISELGEFFAPEPLSNKYGGSMTTVTDKQGRERLVSRAFRVVVRLNNDLHLLKPGMRGEGRFLVEERTAWQWIKRYFYETFRFRL